MSVSAPGNNRRKVSFYLSQSVLDELDQFCQEEGDEDRSVILRRVVMGFLKKARLKLQALEELFQDGMPE